MATATSLDSGGYKNAWDTIAASAVDSVLVAGKVGFKIRVHAFSISCGATPSTVQFNTKPAGASSPVSPVFNNTISLSDLEKVKSGWFETAAGDTLTVSTGAGSNTAVIVVHEFVPV